MASFRYERQVAAPPEIVFEVLTDHLRYPQMTSLRRAELEREGEPPPNGLGAIRALTLIGPPMREEVIAFEPPHRFSYKILSGLPVRDHVGAVELTPEAGGTRVAYAVRTTPTVPVGGALVVAGIKQGIRTLLNGVRKESERRTVANG